MPPPCGKREGARPGAKGQSRGDVHVMTERDPVRDVPMCAGPGTGGQNDACAGLVGPPDRAWPDAAALRGVHAVAGVSFDVPRGRITGLIGPNGVGKPVTEL